MCRMIVAAGEVRLDSLIDGLILMANDANEDHEYNQENKGSFKHEDGWGIAFYDKDWIVVKSTVPCYEDEAINNLRGVETKLAVLHARKASNGGVKLDNTHPFHIKDDNCGNYVFCHNGDVIGEVPEKGYKPNGDTDSEELFCCMTASLLMGSEGECIVNQIKRFKSPGNFILSSPEKIFVENKYSGKPKYFSMKMGQRDGLIVVSSEVLSGSDLQWSPIPNQSLLKINPSSQDYSIITVG